MKTVKAAFIAVALFAAAAAAQTPPPGVKPPFPMPPQTPFDTLVSPDVAPDGHITFRFYAPKAQSVVVKPWFAKDPIALTKAATASGP